MAKYSLKVLSGTNPNEKRYATHIDSRIDLKPYGLTISSDTLKEGMVTLIRQIYRNPALRPNKLIHKIRTEDRGIGTYGQYIISSRGPSGKTISYVVTVHNFARDDHGSIVYTQTDGKGKYYYATFYL